MVPITRDMFRSALTSVQCMENVAPKKSVTKNMRWVMRHIIFMLLDYLPWFAVSRCPRSVLRVQNLRWKRKRKIQAKKEAKRGAEKEAEKGATKNMSMEQMSLYYET